MEQSTTGGITPCLWFTSSLHLHCTFTSERQTHIIKTLCTDLHSHTLLHPCQWNCQRNHLRFGHFMGMEWSQGCVPPLCLQAWSGDVWTRGQIISNELCKSLQSITSWQWVMLKTPSQRDYMNIFIGQKEKESQMQTFSISVKSGSFVLMTRRAGI